MYKRLILVLLVGIVVALPLSSANAAEAFKTTTELIQWDPDQARFTDDEEANKLLTGTYRGPWTL